MDHCVYSDRLRRYMSMTDICEDCGLMYVAHWQNSPYDEWCPLVDRSLHKQFQTKAEEITIAIPRHLAIELMGYVQNPLQLDPNEDPSQEDELTKTMRKHVFFEIKNKI